MDKNMKLPVRLTESISEGLMQKVQLLRTGKFNYNDQGDLDITQGTLRSLKKNFDDKVRGYDDGKLPIDYFHEGDRVAAGWIEQIELGNNDTELWAVVKWTPKAKTMLNDGELRYLSAEFNFDYQPNEGRAALGPTLFGGGLTNRPFIKGMEPVAMFDEITEKGSAQHETSEKVVAQDQTPPYDSKDPMDKLLSPEIKAKLSKGEPKMSEPTKKDAPAAGDMSPEDMQKKIGELQAALAEAMNKCAEYEAKMGEVDKKVAMTEKSAKFDKMLTDGKAVEAQREPFMSDDMVKFAELAQPLNSKGKASNAGAPEADEDFNKKIISLAEAKAKDKGVSIGKAISMVLGENPDLNAAYEKATTVRKGGI